MKKILLLAVLTFSFSALVHAQSNQKTEEASPSATVVTESAGTDVQVKATEAEASGKETKAVKKSCGSKSAKAGCCSSKKGKSMASAGDKDCCAEAKKSGVGCDHAKADAPPMKEQ